LAFAEQICCCIEGYFEGTTREVQNPSPTEEGDGDSVQSEAPQHPSYVWLVS